MENFKSSIFKIVLAIGLVSMMFGCSKDEPAPDNWIVGKWFWESIDSPDIVFEDCMSSNYYEFRADGSGLLVLFGDEDGVCQQTLSDEGSYQLLSDSQIKFTAENGDENTINIVSHTDTKLVLTLDNATHTLVKR